MSLRFTYYLARGAAFQEPTNIPLIIFFILRRDEWHTFNGLMSKLKESSDYALQEPDCFQKCLATFRDVINAF